MINGQLYEEISTYDSVNEDEKMENQILKNSIKVLRKYNYSLLEIINNPFNENIGEILLKFICRLIIITNAILDRPYYVHFNINDINPENLLINNNLVKKLSVYSLLRQVKKVKISGITLEYYENPNETSDKAKKEDYFGLGLTLFFLRYGQKLSDYKQYKDIIENYWKQNEILIPYIKSHDLTGDQNCIDFLCSLISPSPKYRPSFEEIYRNKWLNKDTEITEEIVSGFGNEEEKLVIELQKEDYLIKKKNEIKNQMDESRGKHCKFRYKKKIKENE